MPCIVAVSAEILLAHSREDFSGKAGGLEQEIRICHVVRAVFKQSLEVFPVKVEVVSHVTEHHIVQPMLLEIELTLKLRILA